jgi:H3 lysine-79-specific histone-lysine N-methyltransferase
LRDIIDAYRRSPTRRSHWLEALESLCEQFNKWCDNLSATNADRPSSSETSPIREAQQGSTPLIKFIMHLIYNRAVLDPDKLNHYEPFSPQVYGETSFDLVDQLIRKVDLKEDDVFLDLGSG